MPAFDFLRLFVAAVDQANGKRPRLKMVMDSTEHGPEHVTFAAETFGTILDRYRYYAGIGYRCA